jgi:hypothetical protein
MIKTPGRGRDATGEAAEGGRRWRPHARWRCDGDGAAAAGGGRRGPPSSAGAASIRFAARVPPFAKPRKAGGTVPVAVIRGARVGVGGSRFPSPRATDKRASTSLNRPPGGERPDLRLDAARLRTHEGSRIASAAAAWPRSRPTPRADTGSSTWTPARRRPSPSDRSSPRACPGAARRRQAGDLGRPRETPEHAIARARGAPRG